MMVLVNAAGMMVMGITMWQNGVSPAAMSDVDRAMLPRTSMRLAMKLMTNVTAMVTNSTAR